jgi:hypothetical protein
MSSLLDKPQLTISLKEARKLLGKEAANLKDEEVENMISAFSTIAKIYIQSDNKY